MQSYKKAASPRHTFTGNRHTIAAHKAGILQTQCASAETRSTDVKTRTWSAHPCRGDEEDKIRVKVKLSQSIKLLYKLNLLMSNLHIIVLLTKMLILLFIT